MSSFKRCLPSRGVHLSMFERFLTLTDVHLQEVSTFKRCLPSRGLCLLEVSSFERCLSSRGVHLREVSTFKRCLPSRGVYFQEVSTIKRCLPSVGVCLPEVSTFQMCLNQLTDSQMKLAGTSQALMSQLSLGDVSVFRGVQFERVHCNSTIVLFSSIYQLK